MGKYSLKKENKLKTIIVNLKNMLFKKNRAFNMLKKGSKSNEPVIGSEVHRSFK